MNNVVSILILFTILFSIAASGQNNAEPRKPEQLMAPESLADVMNN